MAKLDSLDGSMRELNDTVKHTVSRVAEIDQDVTTIKAERKRMVEEYDKFVDKVEGHIQSDVAWKSRFEGAGKTMRWVWIVVTAIIAALGWLGAQVLSHPDTQAATSRTVQTVTVPMPAGQSPQQPPAATR